MPANPGKSCGSAPSRPHIIVAGAMICTAQDHGDDRLPVSRPPPHDAVVNALADMRSYLRPNDIVFREISMVLLS